MGLGRVGWGEGVGGSVAFADLADDFCFATEFGVDGVAVFEEFGFYAGELAGFGLSRQVSRVNLGLKIDGRGVNLGKARLTRRLPRRVTARRTTPGV